ncbi:MAG: biotin/lipoyl-binding protein [Anaerolineaceae bacterium]|nr:MAG: biotin/lipoyl-binding protein [Anaerolineaceae bacterium]
MKYVTILDGESYEVEIDKDGKITVNGEGRDVDFLALSPSLYSIISDNRSVQLVIDDADGTVEVLMKGRMYETQVLDERALMMAQRRGGLGSSSGDVQAPMPGLVVAVPVNVGDAVEKGQTVVVLESMKMQNELKSPIDGVVQTVTASAGQSVNKNDLLVTVTPPEE